jgi:FkbM family methyltransferase
MPLFRKIAALSYKIGDYFTRKLEGEKGKTLRRWINDKGDEILRLNYSSLTEDAFVMDIGGYRGQWTSDIYAKYNCRVWVFEPVREFALQIQQRFSKNKKIRVFDFGLGSADEERRIYIDNEGSSFFKQHQQTAPAVQRSISQFFRDNNISEVDLVKINIEGGEYDLLDSLIESGLVKKLKNIQVQFHDFVPDAGKRMRQVQEKLKRTHSPTYQYEFVWENWERSQ